MMFDAAQIERLIRGRPAFDAPPYSAGYDAVDAQIRELFDELHALDDIELFERNSARGGNATFLEAFVWPADGRSIRRRERSLAELLRAGPLDEIDGLSLLVSRLAPCTFAGPQTVLRTQAGLASFAPIGLATAAWIRATPGANLVGFASALRSHLELLGWTVGAADQLMEPLVLQAPLDDYGSLMNLGEPNRLFDALFRWCD